jgi:site-specific recombinase XerC
VVTPSRLTFSEVAKEFFAITEGLVATSERSQRTLDLYRQRYDKHISPVVGHRRIQDVRPEHIGAILARQRQAGLAAWTISGTHTIISAIVAHALSRGYINANPLHRLSKMEKPARSPSGRRGGLATRRSVGSAPGPRRGIGPS